MPIERHGAYSVVQSHQDCLSVTVVMCAFVLIQPIYSWARTPTTCETPARKGRIVIPMLRGEDHPIAKLSNADALAIRSSSASSQSLASAYGVHKTTINRIRNRTTFVDIE